MLESQRNIDDVESQGNIDIVNDKLTLVKRLKRVVFPLRNHAGTRDLRAMGYPIAGDRGPSSGSARSWQETGGRVTSGTRRYVVGLGQGVSRTWRERDAYTVNRLLGRNLLAFTLILVSGIITWESSVDELRERIDRSIPFPLYLPHSVALAVACVWSLPVAPGILFGLYMTRVYLIWRGNLGFTAVNCLVMLLVCVLAAFQSHIGAFLLRKFLCKGETKKVPTIDSVKEAMFYVIIVFFLSLIFSVVISLATAITPLVQWASFWRYWTTWWLGVLATMITITPLLTHLLAWEYQTHLGNPCKLLECVLVALVTAGTMVILFFVNFENFRPRAYLCFPVITWTAFRFNRVGWALTVSVIAYCSAVGSIRKKGTLYSNQDASVYSAELIVQVQLFASVMGVVAITLAAAVREKRHLTKRLHHWNIELEQTVNTRTSELRKANEELQISQRNAEQASQSKSDFLANMSHEIRTPIHGILGLTALLLESELTPDQKESLVSVKECADLLLHIINSVLDLAKIEAGRLEVENVPFNIRKMVSSTFRMLQARAQQRGLELVLEVDKGVPQSLVGDVGKLQQCLLNLVGNALKFTHNGSVTVSVKVAAEQTAMPFNADDDRGSKVVGQSGHISLESSRRLDIPNSIFVEFEVRDTGIGISQEALKDMFKPFTQADASTSRLYGGTGLGLCIVQRFVDLLGGTLWAESVLGQGSAFHFRLPFFPESPRESPAESPRLKSDKSRRQSWSLMGGLIFNPAGKYPSELNQLDPRVSTRASPFGPKVRSASDLMQLWEGSNGNIADTKPDSNDFSPAYGHFHDSKPKFSLSARGSESCGIAPDRATAEFEEQNHLDKALSDPVKAINHNNGSSVLSDRSESSEVTPSGQKESLAPSSEEIPEHVQPQNFMSVLSHSSSTLSDWEVGSATLGKSHEGPLDSSTVSGGEIMEREKGDVTELAATVALNRRGYSTSAVSDLSRESSAELDKMIKNKVSLSILLAEDNAINQKVASRQLEKHGHKVTIVGDGKQALDVISSRHDDFDLVLMDVQMPVMDGLTATELIRKAESGNGWPRIPVLGLTAHAIQGYQDICLKHGMDGYLGKPFDIHQLLKTIVHLVPPDKPVEQPIKLTFVH